MNKTNSIFFGEGLEFKLGFMFTKQDLYLLLESHLWSILLWLFLETRVL
jgi:hypothetical protein